MMVIIGHGVSLHGWLACNLNDLEVVEYILIRQTQDYHRSKQHEDGASPE